ncbi:MAG: gluconeogenesis factor YvcK family protein [Candidatus Saccharibacteria bacterium]
MPERFPEQQYPEDPTIVVIGGGSGTAAIYPELVEMTPNAVAIVGMSDSGGSTGIISKELNMLPVGDLRKVMLSASGSPDARSLQQQKLGGEGSLAGHSAANVVVAAFIENLGVAEGVRAASRLFRVPGRVLPVTLDRHDLMMQDGPGLTLRGEHIIDEHAIQSPTPSIWLDPPVGINPEAAEVLDQADLIVVAAGSVYTSQLAALSVSGVREALEASRAPKVLLANLATEQDQTDCWHVVDYAHALARHGIDIDYLLYNNGQPTEEMLVNYKREGQEPVDISPERFAELPAHVRVMAADILARSCRVADPNDLIKKRGIMFHNASAVGDELRKILAATTALSGV